MKKSKTMIIIFTLFFLLFWAKSFFILDPDFGWHLKMGEYILKSGIPSTDPFSYTMSNYPFVDHEWLTNILIAQTFPIVRMAGTALLFSLIAIFVFYSLFREKETLPFITLVLSVIVSFVGIRPQVVTWFFVFVFMYILRKKNLTSKHVATIILLQLVWANLHGGFFLGTILLFLYFVIGSIQEKKIARRPLLVFLLSLLGTILNPYGLRAWWEVGMQLTDYRLHWSIAEWGSSFTFINIPFWLYVGISLSFFIRYFNKMTFFDKAVYLVFILAALSSIRNIPLWIIVSLPMLQQHVLIFLKEIPDTQNAKRRYMVAKKTIWLAVIICVFLQLFFDAKSAYGLTEEGGYPKKATQFIQKEKLAGNIFSPYGWGGYLIWKLPEKKVFIDGRMPSWRSDKNNPEFSNNAYEDYRTVKDKKIGYNKILQKYRITHVLLSRQEANRWKGSGKKIYSDDIAVLFKLNQ